MAIRKHTLTKPGLCLKCDCVESVCETTTCVRVGSLRWPLDRRGRGCSDLVVNAYAFRTRGSLSRVDWNCCAVSGIKSSLAGPPIVGRVRRFSGDSGFPDCPADYRICCTDWLCWVQNALVGVVGRTTTEQPVTCAECTTEVEID
jgi:hypothetical protein